MSDKRDDHMTEAERAAKKAEIAELEAQFEAPAYEHKPLKATKKPPDKDKL